jgi:LPXTG-motif cell wall-anchored protein
MHALVAYRSHDSVATVWAFAVSALIVLAAGWYFRRRR